VTRVLLGLLLLLLPVTAALPARAEAPSETSVVAPTSLAVGPHLIDHQAPGFTLSGFDPGRSLLARVWLVTAPAGVSLGIAQPTGLTAPNGVGGWSGKQALGFRGSASAVAEALGTLTVTTGAATGALVIAVEVYPDPGPTAGLVIDPRSGHLYRYVAGDRTWTQAVSAASSAGFRFDGVDGHLVTITSADENHFVRQNTPSASRLWLGLTDTDDETKWRWVTGPEGAQLGSDGLPGLLLSDVGYSNWDTGLPDNFLNEDYAVMRASTSGRWNDVWSTTDVDGIMIEYSVTDGVTFPSRRSATLTTVIGRPPRSVVATAGDARASVSWEAPAFGTVTGYSVITELAGDGDADPADLPGCATDGALSCTVTGLTNGVPVVFRVEATFTDEGTARSEASDAVTPAAPPPPPPPPPPPSAPGEDLAPGPEEDLEEEPRPAERPEPALDPTPQQGAEPEPAPGPPDTGAAPTPTEATSPAQPDDAPASAASAPGAAVDPSADRRPPFPAFSALDEPAALVATVTSGLALLGVAGSAGAAAAAAAAGAGAARGGSGGGSGGSRGSGSGGDSRQEVEREGVTGIDVVALGLAVGGSAKGDRSRLWRWPGTGRVDRAGVELIRRAAVPAPLVARVVEDGAALRAMFGSLALALPAAGAVLGALSVQDTGGVAMPPSTLLMAAIVLLGLLDAATGLVAFLVFAIGVAISGGIVDGDSVRTLLGVGVASFGPGLIAALFRPIRRPPARTADERWERLTDIAVVSVVGAMSVQLMVGALSGIAGYALPVSDIAGPLALASIPILALRVGLEEVTARHFPARLRDVVPEELPELPTWRMLLTLAGKAAAFVFVGLALIGPVWQLYAAALLFILGPLVGLLGDRLPNSPLLWRLLPQGIPGFVVMLAVGGYSAGLVESWLGTTPDYAQMSFVALAVPYTILALLALFGRQGADGEERWVAAPQRRPIQRVGGIVMLVLLIRLHLG
jgi:hypothetical protein